MIEDVDLATALAALDLDPDDPDDACPVAIVRALADRRGTDERTAVRNGHRSSGPDDLGTGPRIVRLGDLFTVDPTERWRMPCRASVAR